MNVKIATIATAAALTFMGTGIASANDDLPQAGQSSGWLSSVSLDKADQPLLDINRQVYLAGGANYQHYRETQGNGTLDKEEGWMPNIQLDGSWLFDNGIYLDGRVSYTFGDTDYTGQTMAGQPAKNTTKNDIVSFRGRIGYALAPWHRMLLIPYVAYGHRYWKRGLGGDTPYNEEYNSNFVAGGVKMDVEATPRLIVTVDSMVGSTFSNKMDMKLNDVDSRLSNVKFDMGSGVFVDLTAGVDYRFYGNWHVFQNTEYTYFRYGDSDHEPVTANGVTLGSVQEPASHTHNINVMAGIRYTF